MADASIQTIDIAANAQTVMAVIKDPPSYPGGGQGGQAVGGLGTGGEGSPPGSLPAVRIMRLVRLLVIMTASIATLSGALALSAPHLGSFFSAHVSEHQQVDPVRVSEARESIELTCVELASARIDGTGITRLRELVAPSPK